MTSSLCPGDVRPGCGGGSFAQSLGGDVVEDAAHPAADGDRRLGVAVRAAVLAAGPLPGCRRHPARRLRRERRVVPVPDGRRGLTQTTHQTQVMLENSETWSEGKVELKGTREGKRVGKRGEAES